MGIALFAHTAGDGPTRPLALLMSLGSKLHQDLAFAFGDERTD
jgi:hypothetical protein